MDYQFDVYDNWCKTALPGGVFGFPGGFNPKLESWNVSQWEEALHGLLGKYEPKDREVVELSDQQVQCDLDTFKEYGLSTAMHWLLLGLDHTTRYVRQTKKVVITLRALRLWGEEV